MAEETVIRVENVSKDFVLPHERADSVKSLFTGLARLRHSRPNETQHALRDVSFEIKKGEFFGIVGRNGSGKSTLLKILAGIYQPTSGKVHTHGKLVPFIELGVGFNPELTGRENVYLNGAMLGFSEKEVDAMYDSIVKFAELERFMDQKLKNYSSGMQVRLAFSMAVRAEADILLIDEVLAVGDADFQRKCFSYFKKLKRDKKTVVFVSHDMNAIREYCDEAVIIEDSELLDKGDPNRIATEYSKMFTNDAGASGPGEKSKRWGDGAVRYKSTEMSPATLKGEKEFTITTVAEARQNIDNPIFGFSIKDEAGNYILGTNTKFKKLATPELKKGDRVELKWTLPNIFADGTYFINPAVEHADGVTECDWLEEALAFTVYKEDRTHYPIQPPIEVDLKVSRPKKKGA